mgnify:CR=1 FL=1|jgi:hypothetical protein
MQFNYFKALIALAGLIAVTVLMALESINSDAGMPIITMIVGYAIGNGITASQGKDAEPIVKSKNPNSQN